MIVVGSVVKKKGRPAVKLVSIASKRRFLQVSPPFFKKYGSVLFPAYKVILKNLSKLLAAQVVEEKGFVMSPITTGSNKGEYNISLRVDHHGKTFFVKLGQHTASETAIAYSLAREYLASINHRVNGFNVRLVNYRLLYNPVESSLLPRSNKGVLVSDFLLADSCIMLEDLQKQMGATWHDSEICKTYSNLHRELRSRGILDAALKNVFFNPKSKTFFLVDLKVDSGDS